MRPTGSIVRRPSRPHIGRLAAMVMVSGVLAVGCQSSESRSKDQSSLACDHFRNVARDAGAGILTGAELRNKLKEVNDDASIATPAVQSAAQRMLAAITQDQTSAFQSAVNDMGSACSAAGH